MLCIIIRSPHTNWFVLVFASILSRRDQFYLVVGESCLSQSEESFLSGHITKRFVKAVSGNQRREVFFLVKQQSKSQQTF